MNQHDNSPTSNELEIELKFSLRPEAKPLFLDFMAQYSNIKANSFQLSNTYFETEDNFLRQHDMGLRIRGKDNQFEMTLKTASLGMPGMAKRQEYNVDLPDDKLNIHLLPNTVWPTNTDCITLQSSLKAQFTTDFLRTAWLVELPSDNAGGSTVVEIVLDEGVILSGQEKEPLFEVEIELKTGAIADVLTLALRLAELNHLRLSDLSKAARGYMLQKLTHSSSSAETVLSKPKLMQATTLKDRLSNQLGLVMYYEECLLRNLFDIEKTTQSLIAALNAIVVDLSLQTPAYLATLSEHNIKNLIYSNEHNTFKIDTIKEINAL